MRRNIIEGEPGIFPDPVARVFRAVGRVFGRKDHRDRRGGGDRPGSGPRSGSGSGDGGPLSAEELSDLDTRAKPRRDPEPGPERPPD